MKKVLLMALPVLAAVLVVIPTAFAGNGSANKVNADLMFTNASGPAHWVFNAQDLPTGDKGNVLYEDADGVYTATVTDAVVSAKKATFTATVISSTIGYAHQGDTFTWTVYDNGEGSKGTVDTSPSTPLCLVASRTPRLDHAVPHHGRQHPGPLQRLIRPQDANRGTTLGPRRS